MNKKVTSGFIERLNNNEPFWLALPARIIRQLPIGIIMDALSVGGLAELNQSELKLHNKKFVTGTKKKPVNAPDSKSRAGD